MDIFPVSSLPSVTPNVRAGVSVPSPAMSSPPQANVSIAADAGPSAKNLDQAVNRVNDFFAQQGQNLFASFEKDKATGIDVVKIVDRKTNETVTQVPIKEMLAFAQSLEQQQTGQGALLKVVA